MSKLLEQILDDTNILKAKKQVYANRGASGVDGVTVQELDKYLEKHWKSIKEEIRERKYKPQPVRRIEIPKPNGGVRKLGIPTVIDRTIQQAITQVLTPIFDPLFSEHSYGFRPKRRCEDAVVEFLEYLNEGYEWIVDIDLEKFFDNVPQDKLMSYVGRVIHDGDTESLIRRFLKAGVMERGIYSASELGTSQGGNISPLLSNIMLNELDKELEKRGLHFVRYADDCVIAVKSEASANRVMFSITDWIGRKLALKVNMTKTHITRPSNLKYLGFGFYKSTKEKKWKARPHKDSLARLERKLKKLCKRNWSVDLTYRIKKLNEVIRGWINYYAITDMKKNMENIEGRLLTRIRIVIWKQWKTWRKREWGLKKLGVIPWQAKEFACMGDRYMKVMKIGTVRKALGKEKLTKRGLVSPLDYYLERHALKLG